MEFNVFCEKTSDCLGLKFFGLWETRHGSSVVDDKGNKKDFYIEFTNLSSGDNSLFIAEIFEHKRKIYIGSISFENYNGIKSFEHYETQVSPDGRYNSDFMPINESGEEIDGQLWQFYCGKSLKWACKSFLKGGAMTNPKRKPIRIW